MSCAGERPHPLLEEIQRQNRFGVIPSVHRDLRPNTVQVMKLLAILTALVCLGTAQEGQDCTTPDQQNGQCITIRSCDSLTRLLQQSRPPSPEVVDFLRKSQCGLKDKTPLVCCPRGGPVTPGPGPTPQVTDVRISDVSGHRNLRLLPRDVCGLGDPDRLTYGNQTALQEYPWMALLGYTTKRGIGYRCGGTVISNKYILTAAHCVVNLPTGFRLVTIRLGEHNLDTDPDCKPLYDYAEFCTPPTQNFDIEQIKTHADYNKPKLQNDIALIRVKGTIDFSTDAVRPICLPVGADQKQVWKDASFIVAGWGVTENDMSSPVLLKFWVPVVDVAQCAAIYVRSAAITSKQICAGGRNRLDSCGGDSGGPLMKNGQVEGEDRVVQYGIVSFGPSKCSSENRPGVYTRVGYYMDWILDNLKP